MLQYTLRRFKQTRLHLIRQCDCYSMQTLCSVFNKASAACRTEDVIGQFSKSLDRREANGLGSFNFGRTINDGL